jgi:hypothetical protein
VITFSPSSAVVVFGDLAGKGHLLEADHAVALALEAGENLRREAPADAVGLDHGKGAFHSAKRIAGPSRGSA